MPSRRHQKLRGPFKDYALLGDDLVIANKEVGESYIHLISELGMDYSIEKTHKSSNFYEFAKRIVYNGIEVTGFAVGGLVNVYKSYPLLHNFLQTQESHGYVLETEIDQVLFPILFTIHKLKGRSFAREHFDRIYKLYSVFRELSKDRITARFENTFKVISDLFGYSFDLSEVDVNNIYHQVRKRLLERDLESIEANNRFVLKKINRLLDQYLRA